MLYRISLLDLSTSKVKELGDANLPSNLQRDEELIFPDGRFVVMGISTHMDTPLMELVKQDPNEKDFPRTKTILIADIKQLVAMKMGSLMPTEDNTDIESLGDRKPCMKVVEDDQE